MDYFIIALGNPEEKHKNTIHNTGWVIMDEIYDGEWDFNKYANANLSQTNIGNKNLLLIKPQTFMNKSGEVIDFLKKEYSLKTEKLIVIYDDIDLPLGKIKISYDGGDGGHNGLRSIMQHTNSKEFIRLRIGVSKDLGEGKVKKPNIMKPLSENELITFKSLKPSLIKALETIVTKGPDQAMNLFN